MKPDWKYAPSWAAYLGEDADGEWYWYEREPLAKAGSWASQFGSRVERAYLYKHIEARPQRSPLVSMNSVHETTKPAEAGSEGQGA